MFNLQIEPYSQLSIVVRGDTRIYKEDLKKLGGKYNSRLKGGPGWIFPNRFKHTIESYIHKGERIVVSEGDEGIYVQVERKEHPPRHKHTGSSLVDRVRRLEQAIELLLTDEQKKQLTQLMTADARVKRPSTPFPSRRRPRPPTQKITPDDIPDFDLDDRPRKRLLR